MIHPQHDFHSCAFIWHFSAKEVHFVHILTRGHGFQKLSTRTVADELKEGTLIGVDGAQ